MGLGAVTGVGGVDEGDETGVTEGNRGTSEDGDPETCKEKGDGPPQRRRGRGWKRFNCGRVGYPNPRVQWVLADLSPPGR